MKVKDLFEAIEKPAKSKVPKFLVDMGFKIDITENNPDDWTAEKDGLEIWAWLNFTSNKPTFEYVYDGSTIDGCSKKPTELIVQTIFDSIEALNKAVVDKLPKSEIQFAYDSKKLFLKADNGTKVSIFLRMNKAGIIEYDAEMKPYRSMDYTSDAKALANQIIAKLPGASKSRDKEVARNTSTKGEPRLNLKFDMYDGRANGVSKAVLTGETAAVIKKALEDHGDILGQKVHVDNLLDIISDLKDDNPDLDWKQVDYIINYHATDMEGDYVTCT